MARIMKEDYGFAELSHLCSGRRLDLREQKQIFIAEPNGA